MTQLKKQLGTLSSQPITWIIALAFLVRLYACLTTYIVNPDGVYYIHQARAIFYGQWDQLTTCLLNYITLLPFTIAAAFAVVRDWVVASRLVTLLFSTATLIPLYLLIKRYLDKPLSHLTLLVYAFIPVFVNRSADVVRGPIFWFFLCLGFLFFIRQWDSDQPRHRYRTDLYVSCISFLLATWTRTEGAYAIIASGLYLLIARHDKKFWRLWHFSIPMVLILMAGTIGILMIDVMAAHHMRLDRFVEELTQFVPGYHIVRDQLSALISQHQDPVAEFLEHVRTLVWFMPLSIIFNSIWEGFFYPFALLYFIGFLGLRNRLQTHRHLGYLLWLTALSIVILYVHLLRLWLIFDRFLVILILPSCVIVGFGIDNVMQYMQRKFNLHQKTAVAIMISLIILFGLPKSLIPREKDKQIYQQAGHLIAQQKSAEQSVPIMAVCSTVYRWVYFYAHLDYPGTQCAPNPCEEIPATYPLLLTEMKASNVPYLLYEEKQWPIDRFDFKQTAYQNDFEILGRWHHRDTGDLILLKLKGSSPN